VLSPINLTQFNTGKSHKTLETYKTMIGDERDHIEFLTTKSNNFADKTRSSQFNRSQMRLAYNSCYIPAMTYIVTGVNLTELQLIQIQKQATIEYNRKWGIEMHFPICIVYSSPQYGGLGFK
jgi:hypothetical protein